ncbi:MAG: class I SAM-dependent methyltransferase [Acidimicrobiales bacterium]
MSAPGHAGAFHDPSAPLPPEAQQLWEANAPWWQEGFTEGADPEYAEQIAPLLAEHLAQARPERVLDIGCGEGQLSRLAARSPGARQVVGLDPTEAQLATALRRQPGAGRGAEDAGAGRGAEDAGTRGRAPEGDGRGQSATSPAPTGYVRGAAGALPFPDAGFDAAFACLVFEHIEGAEGALGEVGRVLRPGGTFLLLLNHPLLQAPGSGWVDDQILAEQYWRIGPYLSEHHGVEEVEKNVWIPFVHRPLSAYVNALVAAGLYLVAMVEPAPPAGFLARAHEYSEAAAFPRLLVLRAEKLGRPACAPAAAR